MLPLVLVAFALAMPDHARADAIDQPPACPPGARGVSSHAGIRCWAAPCTSDSECRDGNVCRPWRVCTVHSSVPPGGRGGFDRAPNDEELVVGTCEQSAACRGDEEPPPPMVGTRAEGPPSCRDASFCVPPRALPSLPAVDPPTENGSSQEVPASTEPAGRTGCGCDAAPGAAITTAGLVVLFALSRRRR
jgi:uncharacterized protein (TIGR03382 family)